MNEWRCFCSECEIATTLNVALEELPHHDMSDSVYVAMRSKQNGIEGTGQGIDNFNQN